MRQTGASPLVEERRRLGLHGVRVGNFERILDVLENDSKLAGASVLDVGCGHGWFLEAALRRGATVVGIEPDRAVAEAARARGLDVRIGSFPDAVGSFETYDLIAFNDVFEHLPDSAAVLGACHGFLKPGGRLVLNLPDSDGFLHSLARFLAALGVRGPLRRLWQVDYPSPHLFYFNARNLRQCAEEQGFQLVRTQPLTTYRIAGLWPRLTMDGRSRLRAAPAWLFLVLVRPALTRWLHGDILLQIHRRVSTPGPRPETGTKAGV